MKLTDLFVKRPVLAIVVNLVILIAGLQSIRSLSVRQYPRSDIAEIQVSTVYVGANADLVRGFITTPLERVIASADGIDYMESSSSQGISTITVHLSSITTPTPLSRRYRQRWLRLKMTCRLKRKRLLSSFRPPISNSPRCIWASPLPISTRTRSPTT